MSKFPTKYPYTIQRPKTLADGSVVVYWYYRRNGKLLKLDGEPGSPRFDRSWASAAGQQPTRQYDAPPMQAQKMFVGLFDDFVASREHQKLAAATRRTYEHHLARARAHAPFQTLPLAEIENRKSLRPLLFAFRDKLAATPASANGALNTLARVLSWAQERGVIDTNHAAHLELLEEGFADRSGFTIPPALVRRILQSNHVTPEFKRIVRFALLTAARVGDISALTWGHLDGEWLVYTPRKTARKTGVIVQLPIHKLRHLRELLAELPRGAAGEPLFRSERGRAWKPNNIWKRWDAALATLGLVDHNLHPHDMRGTAITTLYEAGCTDAEVCSISGHLIGAKSLVGFSGAQQALKKYVSRSREFAIHAYEKLERELDMRAASAAGDDNVLPFRGVK